MKIIEGICSICLEKYKCAIDFVPPKRTTFRQKLKAFLNSSEKNAIGMLECGHMFHTACVEEWIQPKIVRETITVQDHPLGWPRHYEVYSHDVGGGCPMCREMDAKIVFSFPNEKYLEIFNYSKFKLES